MYLYPGSVQLTILHDPYMIVLQYNFSFILVPQWYCCEPLQMFSLELWGHWCACLVYFTFIKRYYHVFLIVWVVLSKQWDAIAAGREECCDASIASTNVEALCMKMLCLCYWNKRVKFRSNMIPIHIFVNPPYNISSTCCYQISGVINSIPYIFIPSQISFLLWGVYQIKILAKATNVCYHGEWLMIARIDVTCIQYIWHLFCYQNFII